MSFPGALVARHIGLNLICRADGNQAAVRPLPIPGGSAEHRRVARPLRQGRHPQALAIGLGLACPP